MSVDSDFARFGNKSYAINKINSVEVRSHHPYGQGPMFVAGLLAIISLLSVDFDRSAMPAILSIFFGGIAFLAWKKSRVVEYQLFLMTSSSEAQAISSRDGDLIHRLRDRIESAMAGRPV